MGASADRPGPGLPVAVGVAVVVAVVLAILLISGGGPDHKVRLVVPQAAGLISGFDVRMAGEPVGKIESIDLSDDYKAKIVLGIDDEVWPLPVDTVFRERLGGTIKYSDRYVELDRGTSSKTLEDGATVPATQFVDPVEFDALFNTFTTRARTDLTATIDTAGRVAPNVATSLPRALRSGPAASAAADGVVRRLGGDPRALDTLVRSTAGVSRSVAAADPGLGDLISSAAATFAAVASRSRELESTLSQTPATLEAARATAERVDGTLRAAGDLTDRLSSGVDELGSVARPLSGLLRNVVKVAPDARASFATLNASAPDLNALLDRARTPLMGQVESVGREAAKQLGCIRPYTPEIAGLATNWGGIWGAAGDSVDKLFRAQVGVVPFPNEMLAGSGDIAKIVPDGAFQVAFPRPPGQIVNQPWFIPECGITKDALDEAKDPETTHYDPLEKRLVDLGPLPSSKARTR